MIRLMKDNEFDPQHSRVVSDPELSKAVRNILSF
jgi:hypothetical protein